MAVAAAMAVRKHNKEILERRADQFAKVGNINNLIKKYQPAFILVYRERMSNLMTVL